MKRCPECNRTYSDETLQFCLYDGKPLQAVTNPAGAPAPPVMPPPSTSPQPSYTPSVAPASAPASGAAQKAPWALIAVVVVIGFFLFRNHAKPASQPGAPTNPAGPNQPVNPGGNPVDTPVGGQPDTPTGTQPNPSGGQGSAPDTSGLREANDAEKQSLSAAIQQADAAEQEAFRTLSSEPLARSYTGEALQKESAEIEQLRQKNLVYVETQLQNQEFHKFFTNQEGSKAAVDVTETWNSTAYSTRTKQPVGTPRTFSAPQVVLLQRAEGGWMVFRIVPKNAGQSPTQ